MSELKFNIPGKPRAKQSFRYTANGGGYTDQKVKRWQNNVSEYAAFAMIGYDRFTGPLEVSLFFRLPDHRRIDLDNLSKAVLDGLNKIVFDDDRQIEALHLYKEIADDTGVTVVIARM